jgi:hypothetical protein
MELVNTLNLQLLRLIKKGGKYRIINCFPSEEPQDSIIKTVKTNYKLSN